MKHASPISIRRSFNATDYLQGYVERKCLLKNYKKPSLSKWKRYWLIIGEHLIFFYKPKSLLLSLSRTNTRDDYQDNPWKCQSIRDCLIVLTQTKDRNEIQLSDLNHGKKKAFAFIIIR